MSTVFTKLGDQILVTMDRGRGSFSGHIASVGGAFTFLPPRRRSASRYTLTQACRPRSRGARRAEPGARPAKGARRRPRPTKGKLRAPCGGRREKNREKKKCTQEWADILVIRGRREGHEGKRTCRPSVAGGFPWLCERPERISIAELRVHRLIYGQIRATNQIAYRILTAY